MTVDRDDTYHFRDEDGYWVVLKAGAGEARHRQTAEPQTGKRTSRPPDENPAWYIDKDSLHWRTEPVSFARMIVVGFTLLPSLGIPSIVLGAMTGGALMIPLLAEFTVARTAVCIAIALLISLQFIVYAIEKERAINSDAYVEIGGYLIGFFLVSSLSVILAVRMV